MKHACGCVTWRLQDGTLAIRPCKKHAHDGYVWVALQHEDGKPVIKKGDEK